MALTKTQTKLALFGMAFLFLLAQNAFLVHHKKEADRRVAELEREVTRLEAALKAAESAGLSNSSQSAR
jgi:hypothetical protein